MDSKKVKEIKKALEFNTNNSEHARLHYIDGYNRKIVTYADILTLINELESENDTLHTNLCEWRRENQQLKDRIAEFGKEIEENASYVKGYADGIKNTYEVVMPDKLKQFAEKLKAKIVSMNPKYGWARKDTNEKLIKQGATIRAINELLKEYEK